MVKWHLHLLGHTVAIAKDHADRSRETELIFASFLVLALSCGLMALYGAEPPDPAVHWPGHKWIHFMKRLHVIMSIGCFLIEVCATFFALFALLLVLAGGFDVRAESTAALLMRELEFEYVAVCSYSFAGAWLLMGPVAIRSFCMVQQGLRSDTLAAAVCCLIVGTVLLVLSFFNAHLVAFPYHSYDGLIHRFIQLSLSRVRAPTRPRPRPRNAGGRTRTTSDSEATAATAARSRSRSRSRSRRHTAAAGNSDEELPQHPLSPHPSLPSHAHPQTRRYAKEVGRPPLSPPSHGRSSRSQCSSPSSHWLKPSRTTITVSSIAPRCSHTRPPPPPPPTTTTTITTAYFTSLEAGRGGMWAATAITFLTAWVMEMVRVRRRTITSRTCPRMRQVCVCVAAKPKPQPQAKQPSQASHAATATATAATAMQPQPQPSRSHSQPFHSLISPLSRLCVMMHLPHRCNERGTSQPQRAATAASSVAVAPAAAASTRAAGVCEWKWKYR